MKITLVEIMLWVAIFLIPASLVLRIMYGAQWLEWEYHLIKSWGINTVVYDFTKIIGLLSVGIFFVVRDKRRKKQNESGYYELPKSK